MNKDNFITYHLQNSEEIELKIRVKEAGFYGELLNIAVTVNGTTKRYRRNYHAHAERTCAVDELEAAIDIVRTIIKSAAGITTNTWDNELAQICAELVDAASGYEPEPVIIKWHKHAYVNCEKTAPVEIKTKYEIRGGHPAKNWESADAVVFAAVVEPADADRAARLIEKRADAFKAKNPAARDCDGVERFDYGNGCILVECALENTANL